jgi:hypothetical protein
LPPKSEIAVVGSLTMTTHLDDGFSALVHTERRQLLLALADHNPQQDTTFDCLDAVSDASSERRDDGHTRRHRLHLPMLDATGFIERQGVGATDGV